MLSPAAATSWTCSTGVGAMKNAASYSPLRTSSSAWAKSRAYAESVEVIDVLVGHPERALEDQRLEHRGVEPPVGLGVTREGGRRRSPGL